MAECISSCRAQASQGTAFEKCRRFEEKCSRGWTEGDSFAVDSDSLACPGIVVKALPLHLDLKPPARKCKKTNTAKFVLTLLWAWSSCLRGYLNREYKDTITDTKGSQRGSLCTLYHQPTKKRKHCQRHNGPEGWVLLTKVTYFSHITRSNTKFHL